MNLQRIRVPAGFLFVAFYLYWSLPAPVWFGVGVALAALGQGLRIWASGHLEKWRRLAVTGPYRWSRNPLYLGSLLMGLGFSLAAARLLLVLLCVALFVLIYVPVMRREEEELQQAYGRHFHSYRKQVPLILPRRRPPRSPEDSQTVPVRFRWQRVISNREYNAVAGFVALSALLALKMLWK